MKCASCGASCSPTTKRCEYCGSYLEVTPPPSSHNRYAPLTPTYAPRYQQVTYVHTQDQTCAPQSRLVALLLCLFGGTMGLHRFYVGKIGTGIVYLCSWGCMGIGVVIDLISIVSGTFTNKQGRPLRK